MYALSCAHKLYPFGTRLKVTNTTNYKTVECVVNDRGPFVSGRDIDLSYGAAKAIGLIGPGTASVYLQVAGRDSSYVKTVKMEAGDRRGPFAVQVGSFSDGTNAIRLKTAVDLEYGNVYIQETSVSGGIYYRVRVGNFPLLKDALATAEKLGQEGYPVMVVKADVKI